MFSLRPNKHFHPPSLAEMFSAEVEDPELVRWIPRKGGYEPSTLTLDDVHFHLQRSPDAIAFLVDLAGATSEALVWSHDGCEVDPHTAERQVPALRRAIAMLQTVVREMESASSEEPYSVCIWCGELSPGLSERRWCPSCEAGACPQCGEEPLRGSGECDICEQLRQDWLQERREQTEREEAEREEADDGRIYDLGQQVLDEFEGLGYPGQEVAPGVTVVRLGGGL